MGNLMLVFNSKYHVRTKLMLEWYVVHPQHPVNYSAMLASYWLKTDYAHHNNVKYTTLEVLVKESQVPKAAQARFYCFHIIGSFFHKIILYLAGIFNIDFLIKV